MASTKGTSTSVKKFKCDYCLRHFPTQSSLRTHKKTHSTAAEYTTTPQKARKQIASATTTTDQKQRSNMTPRKLQVKPSTSHDGRAPHGTPTPTKRPGQNPTGTPRTPDQHVCRKCHKGFPSRPLLVKHISTHSVDSPASKRQRILHSRTDYRHSPSTKPPAVLPFKCELCRRMFRQSSSLNAHVLTHVNKPGYNPGECMELCPGGENNHTLCAGILEKQTGTPHANIENHENIEGNLTGYTTETTAIRHNNSENTTPVGTSIGDLNKAVKEDIARRRSAYFDTTSDHDSVESDLFPYRCTVCNLGFDDTSQLLEHSTLHARHKPYTCATCRKSFGNRKTLKLHEKVHAITRLRGILEERRDQQTAP